MVVSFRTCGRAPDSCFTSGTDMRRYLHVVVAAFAACTLPIVVAAADAQTELRFAPGTPPITVRPSALAQLVSEIAGTPVQVPHARILWVIDAHAIVIESDSLFDPTWRDRSRVLVVLDRSRFLAIPNPPVAIAPVDVVGIARTLLGIQASQGMLWPPALRRREVERMDIKAAVLASSIRTSDGVELTSSTAPEVPGRGKLPAAVDSSTTTDR
jgi:hypothetical protein